VIGEARSEVDVAGNPLDSAWAGSPRRMIKGELRGASSLLIEFVSLQWRRIKADWPTRHQDGHLVFIWLEQNEYWTGRLFDRSSDPTAGCGPDSTSKRLHSS
jgi:hypothetical protein